MHYLSLSGKKMQDFGLPVPQQRTREVVDKMVDLQRNHAMFVHDSQYCLALLTEEQCNIFDDIMHSVLNEDPNHIMSFIEGCPGRGKTFLIQTILATLCADFHIVLVVGTSALSAIAYHQGRMAHYMFGIPVTDDNMDLHSKIPPHSARADLIRHTKAIIWDELPMANNATWECMNNLCQDITRHYNLPFGGKKLIASGDFRQVAPVIPGCGEMATLAASVKTSHLWSKMHVYTLHAPIRTMSDSEFTCFINDIGEDITNVC